jgi:hypothetical protein
MANYLNGLTTTIDEQRKLLQGYNGPNLAAGFSGVNGGSGFQTMADGTIIRNDGGQIDDAYMNAIKNAYSGYTFDGGKITGGAAFNTQAPTQSTAETGAIGAPSDSYMSGLESSGRSAASLALDKAYNSNVSALGAEKSAIENCIDSERLSI